jgi:hypothetical protein
MSIVDKALEANCSYTILAAQQTLALSPNI